MAKFGAKRLFRGRMVRCSACHALHHVKLANCPVCGAVNFHHVKYNPF
jgi:LSD1 subclass zinc finger protein